MFNKAEFDKQYTKTLKALTSAEKITRAALLDLSRSTLEALHATEDIAYVNKVLAVLTPVNKRVAVLYYKALSGFNQNKETGEFSSKDKKHYDKVKEEAIAFLADPHNNIWTWADRNVEVEAKPLTTDQLKKQFERLLDKSNEAGIDQLTVLKQFMEAGLKLDTVLYLMKEIQGEQV